MDPNATLAELRAEFLADEMDETRVAELFGALDSWLTRGGFLPSDWQASR